LIKHTVTNPVTVYGIPCRQLLKLFGGLAGSGMRGTAGLPSLVLFDVRDEIKGGMMAGYSQAGEGDPLGTRWKNEAKTVILLSEMNA